MFLEYLYSFILKSKYFIIDLGKKWEYSFVVFKWVGFLYYRFEFLGFELGVRKRFVLVFSRL